MKPQFSFRDVVTNWVLPTLLGCLFCLATIIYSPAVLADDFTKATLVNADFTGKDLTSYEFTQASVRNGKFANANLTGVSLIGANFDSADLTGVNLTNALMGLILQMYCSEKTFRKSCVRSPKGLIRQLARSLRIH
jgi:uncharacterized protein YjbI with pentapeptide repeats